MILQYHGFGVQVVIDNCLEGAEWGAHIIGYTSPRLFQEGNSEQHYLLIGSERVHQLIFDLQVKPEIIETDPGPLDAKVTS
jgi:hypothetical protein